MLAQDAGVELYWRQPGLGDGQIMCGGQQETEKIGQLSQRGDGEKVQIGSVRTTGTEGQSKNNADT